MGGPQGGRAQASGTILEVGTYDQEDRMIGKGYASASRGERPGPPWPDKKFDTRVKLFLDNRAGKLYPPRFNKKEGPTLRG